MLSYQGEDLSVSIAFGGLWSSNKMKKLNVIRKRIYFEIFCENHPPTRHTKFKGINFAPIY